MQFNRIPTSVRIRSFRFGQIMVETAAVWCALISLRYQPDAIITSATLYIYTSDSSTGVITSVYRVTSPWSETTATWNSPWSTAGGDYNNLISYASYSPNAANCMVTLNLTSLVSQWVNGTYQNYGILLLSTGNNHAFRYVSKEETTNLQNRPRLSVTYTTPTKKGTAIFLDWFKKTPKP